MEISPKNISFSKTKDWFLLLELEKTMLGNQIYRPIIDINKLKKYFSKSIIFKVNINGSLAGYCAYELNQKIAEITGLLVIDKFRRKGLGELMLKKIIKDLKNIKIIKVITSPENTVTLRLYLKHGFVIKEWINNYWQGKPRLVLYRINK